MSEAIAMMAQKGTTIDAKLLDRCKPFVEKVKPLKDLDKNYKHMISVLNMVHAIAKKGYSSMISPSHQEELKAILRDMGIQDPLSYVINVNNVDAGGAELHLEKAFLDLQRKDGTKLREVLLKHSVSERELESWFFSFFGFLSVERARTDFDQQKMKTFPAQKRKAFEQDVNSRRGMARQRLLTVQARMTTTVPREFATPQDFDFASSYFDKFQNLFYADEEDADETTGGGNYQKMRDMVAALVRERVPALMVGDRRRFGSRLRKTIKFVTNPKILKHLNRRYRDADDAELIAMVIMSQNEASNTMFYSDKDPFKKKG